MWSNTAKQVTQEKSDWQSVKAQSSKACTNVSFVHITFIIHKLQLRHTKDQCVYDKRPYRIRIPSVPQFKVHTLYMYVHVVGMNTRENYPWMLRTSGRWGNWKHWPFNQNESFEHDVFVGSCGLLPCQFEAIAQWNFCITYRALCFHIYCMPNPMRTLKFIITFSPPQ